MERLTQIIEYSGPQSFSKEIVSAQVGLFQERSALIYTPTGNLPSDWIGTGPLDVTLPLPTPSFHEFREIHAYRSPRLWVDLLQRATGKIRWTPLCPARLTIIRYDIVLLPYHAFAGTKALTDALKLKTTGRSDRRLLYYFGAIHDDGPNDIPEPKFEQELVQYPSEARTRIMVRPLQP
jgi:hypothetical protein